MSWTKKHRIKRHNKSVKGKGILSLINKTPKSYAPTINRQLVSFRSLPRSELKKCNNFQAFLLKEPLQIQVLGKCYPYTDMIAQEFLLKKLRANKHIQPSKMITPFQSLGNCWFNTMFVTFFMSDKGRKFFHFFRQLMIVGKQVNGGSIPEGIWRAFSLLNFAIEACLTGNEYAYKINTNKIIKQIYTSIPEQFRNHYIVDVDVGSNPIYYYDTLMDYLNVKVLNRMLIVATSEDWKQRIEERIVGMNPPHYIVMEIRDEHGEKPGHSGIIKNKEQKFTVKDYTYELDSCVIRDVEQQHFSSLLTCEKKEYAYDGLSFHRIVPMNWKKNINSSKMWEFDGESKGLKWSFLHGYQILFYYRTK